MLTLTNVGFDVLGTVRPMWVYQANDAELWVEIEARNPDQTTTTKQALLGTNARLGRAGWNLTPLYDAGASLAHYAIPRMSAK